MHAPRRHAPATTRQRPIVVIDSDPSWRAMLVAGHLVEVVDPRDATCGALLGYQAPRTVLNLAVPGALDTLARLRADGFTNRIFGCLSLPGTQHAIGIGPVEMAPRPLQPERVLATLCDWMPADARIIAAGGDGAAYLALRRTLAAERYSVSLAWDTNQAADLLAMIRADLVLVDLDLAPRGAHAFVAQLGALETVPAAVLLPSAGDDGASFQAAATQLKYASFVRKRQEVLARILRMPEVPSRVRPLAVAPTARARRMALSA